ncbi:MAG: beta-glucosidase [Candidatus Adiutrix sp.]|jgi:hypothetical protein|nr:beta-glucosidase [Candidatus Adiutrix sp.]
MTITAGLSPAFKVCAATLLSLCLLLAAPAGAFWADTDYLADRQALDSLQREAFLYMWEDGDPESGMAYEANFGWEERPVAVGGSGFGAAAIVVAADRGWISRDQALSRLLKIARFLTKTAEAHPQWHGGFPHWLSGRTGEVFNYGDGEVIDTVETALLMQGLLIARAYFNGPGSEAELRGLITKLWHAVEWDWFSNSPEEENGIFWHWSPDPERGYLGLRIRGYNEALITYVLALASPTHPISRKTYDYWSTGPDYRTRTVFGYRLEGTSPDGGPLFLAHYSFVGLDPRRLADKKVPGGYFARNVAQTLSNREYCLTEAPSANQYGPNFWGLSASQIKDGYTASSPANDQGAVAPTAALSSMPYTPHYSMEVMHNLKSMMNGRAWSWFGPLDGVSPHEGWVSDHYLAIDQLPIVLMVENYRSGLLWNLFMADPEVRAGLDAAGLTPPELKEGFPEAVVTVAKEGRKYVPDAYDLRRHPDTGLYSVPFWCQTAEEVTFTVAGPENAPPLFEQSVKTTPGRNFLTFPQFRRNDGKVLTLTLTTTRGQYTLPMRLH